MALDHTSTVRHKQQLRKSKEAERSALPAATRQQKSADICRRALAHLRSFYNLALPQYCILYAFMPIRAEVDVTPVMEWGWLQGIQIAVPRVAPLGKQLQFHFVYSLEDLQPQPPWGIREPSASAPEAERPHFQTNSFQCCMLVPGVAFDPNGNRLGYGGGYYDKYFRHIQLSGGILPFRLALAYDLQIVAEVPCEEHDFRVDRIITESRLL